MAGGKWGMQERVQFVEVVALELWLVGLQGFGIIGMGESGMLGLLKIAAEIRSDRLAILAAMQSIAFKTGAYVLQIQWFVGFIGVACGQGRQL